MTAPSGSDSRSSGSPDTTASGRRRALVCGSWILLYLAAAAATAVLVALSDDFGVTFDERPRHRYGEQVVAFYRGELPRSVFRENGGHLYAALFDASAVLLHEWAGGDVYIVRHRLNAFVGGLGILVTGVLAARLGGVGAGLLAMLLLALSPRYIGHSMNNPKDLPFAVFCAAALLSFTLVRGQAPILTWARALVIGLALALPLNVRPGALLYLGYLGILLAGATLAARAWTPRLLAGTAAQFALVAVVMLLAGTLLWPWAQAQPFERPVQALFGVSRFDWQGQVLFRGGHVTASQVPPTYLPTWMLITIPPVVLAGAAASMASLRDARVRWLTLGLWGVTLTPLVLAAARGSTLYDGWRHVLFVYPSLIVVAAIGWRTMLAVSERGIRVAVLAALLVGCAEPLGYMVRSHPHEVVYFNSAVNGPRGAFRRYELDYWGNALLAASEWTSGLARRSGTFLRVTGSPWSLVRADLPRFPALIPSPAPDAHVEIRLLRGSRNTITVLANRADALHVIRTADGAPLAVVLPGPRMQDVWPRVVPHLSLQN
jgi:hypothetical protein